ncbi:hypothetical protein ABK040_006291 [Willaertia magna]
MTNISSQTVTCVMCKKTSSQKVLLSTNSMGASDLDLRPPPMKRNTMETWLQRCPHCGFVSYELSELPEVDQQQQDNLTTLINNVLTSTSYQDQLNNNQYPTLANTFLCNSILQKDILNNFVTAGWSCLRAAWVCDDAHQVDNAIECRKKATEHFTTVRKNGSQISAQTGTDELLLCDLKRRCNLFEEALEECAKAELKKNQMDEFVWKIIEFEKTLIEKKDAACHNIREVQ